LRDRLVENLKALTDPNIGVPIFDSVHRKEELYSGVYLEKAPDIIALLTRYTQETNYFSNELLGEAPNHISGYHRLDGFCLFSGAMFVKSPPTHMAKIIDMAPTILSLFGIAPPADMDGRILEEFVAQEWKNQRGLSKLATVKDQIQEKMSIERAVFTEEEEKLIQERLRQLGYI
jgi:predicted AlkP superfamily phosphohydrolase/phosphomutase